MVERSKNHSELGHVYSIHSKIIFFLSVMYRFCFKKNKQEMA